MTRRGDGPHRTPVTARTDAPVSLGTDPHAGTTGSDRWYL